MFGLGNVNLKAHQNRFATLASGHSFEQKIPLLLMGQIQQDEMALLRARIIDIMSARAGMPLDSLMASDSTALAIRETLRKMVENNVGNVVELGDGQFIEYTTALRSQLSMILQRSGFINSIGLIQRFPNVRIKVGPFSKEQEHYSHPLSTAKMHCDIWAGAPESLLICIMEILNIDNGPKVEFAEVKSFPLSLAKRLKGYDDPRAVKFLSKKVKSKITSEEGYLHVLNTFTPHRTIYPGNGLRVSIDFRIVLKECMTQDIAESLKGPQFCDPCEWVMK